MEAEALDADSLFAANHFFTQVLEPDDIVRGQIADGIGSPNFEGTAIEAAMAVTITRPEIGCTVHAILMQYLPDNDPDVLHREIGATHIHALTTGPDWDIGPLKELLQRRDALQRGNR
jgi:hypothetical protein